MADRLAAVRGRTLAADHGLPYIELRRLALSPDAVRSAPLEILDHLEAVPFDVVDGMLHVALTAPSAGAVAELERVSGRPVAVALAAPEDVRGILDDLARGGTVDVEQLEVEAGSAGGAPAVVAVNEILRAAVAAQASDVHVIPAADRYHVRLRIDGVVQEHSHLAPVEAAAAVSRIKVLAGLDVAERRRPQDGRFGLRTTAGRPIDVRTAILPTVHGEGVVLRLLGKIRTPPSFTDLGLSNAMQMEIERLVERAVGAVLVTGPTGSGKSTTLHAALADIARPDRTVITVEDPVEYELAGTYQIQVNPVAGVTFPAALRSVLRGDPDVLMVGEIRDHETARLALSASLTGHFVLSTLHTGDAPSAVTRLVEMGVEHYVVAAALSGVVAQRLARRLCLYCREPYEPSESLVVSLGLDPEACRRTFFRAHGCPHCTGGYRGRIGVFQLLTIDEQLRGLICAGASHDDTMRVAGESGMVSLWHDGLGKVEAGLTSVEELHRVVPRTKTVHV
jgi:type IV pilus assembly protein PilB